MTSLSLLLSSLLLPCIVLADGGGQAGFANSYEQPQNSYTAYAGSSPASAYAEPTGSGYAATGSEVGEDGFDIAPLQIPLTVLFALIFYNALSPVISPVLSSVTTAITGGAGRRLRRSTGEEESAQENLVSHISNIFSAVSESEDCFEKIACEIGSIAAEAGVNKGVTKMAETYVPKKYQKMMKTFNSGKDCHKIKCGTF